MDEILLKFNRENPVSKEEEVEIQVENNTDENLEYKFILGNFGIWTTLREFSSESVYKWIPTENGSYIFMVQGKKKDSSKPFDYLCKGEILVGEEEEKIINNVFVNSHELQVGEKISIEIESSKRPVLFRFWKSGQRGWELIKDYSPENSLIFTASEEGNQEILIEAKEPASENNFDDFYSVKYKVNPRAKVEISNFRCLTQDLLCGEELNFQVESKGEETSTMLYKFVKINEEGKALCIQDYSSKTIVSFSEQEPGEYKLLCLAKDIYSNKEFDDRALMVYTIKAYKPILIKSFTTDLASPQVNGAAILLRAFVEGGKNLLYRFKIDGTYGEDSGFIKNSTYLWKSKSEGEYKITLYVKDASFEGDYEDTVAMEYFIDRKSARTIKITDVVMDKDSNYLVGVPINIKVLAEGGSSLKYSFTVFKNKKEIEKVNYGTANWVNFTPEESGEYEMEIRVKDKYSPKEYDCHSVVYFDIITYIPGKIDYILLPSKEFYMVGDDVELEAIVQNSQSTLINYITKINGHVVEETGFIKNKKLKLTPKIPGKYTFELYAKNIKCQGEYDTKKEFHIYINDSAPITGTKIISNNINFKLQDEINFNVECKGGKDVCYEFYIMERGNWVRTQGYSKKSYYSFRPFVAGKFKILVLTKSYYKKNAYEDYDIIEFKVSE